MSNEHWSTEVLSRIGGSTELQIASRRRDGSLRPYITIWTVAAGEGLYVRSARGADNPWFRRAVVAGRGRVRAGGVERDVEFARPDPDDPVHAEIDAAYHRKYDAYGQAIVGTVTGDPSNRATLCLVPHE